MSRGSTVVVVFVAGIAMWLALGWPSSQADVEAPAQAPPVAVPPAPPAITPKPKAVPGASRPAVSDEPPKETPSAPEQPAPSAANQVDILAGDRGPVEQYRRLYDRQTRDSEATHVETAIRSAFTHSETPDLMQSASCHQTICKVLIHWSTDRARDYIMATRWLALGTAWPPGQPGFDIKVAITSASKPDRDGSRLIELYLKRKPPHAAQQ